MVCFFDALRDTVKKDAKSPERSSRRASRVGCPIEPRQKTGTYPEMTLCDTLKNFFTTWPERQDRCVKSQTISSS
jgi:hypothetical protein